MKVIEIHSLKELCETVKELNKNNVYWFRGHSNEEYKLLPSSYRKLIIHNDQYYRPVKPKVFSPTVGSGRGEEVFIPSEIYINSFVEEMNKQGIKYNSEMNKIDMFCFAQHYGVWTPMLDWTTDFSVACFFATDNRKQDSRCVIYMLNPIKWNDRSFNKNYVPKSEELTTAQDLLPIAFYGSKNNVRICRQSGNFTLHGIDVRPLEQFVQDNNEILIKLILSETVSNELENYLKAFGINKESIYVGEDEKDVISKSLKDINEKTFNKKIEEFTAEWERTPEKDRGWENPYF